jgi:hypothetical protein
MYPPFLFFGIKVKISKEYHEINLFVPLRWYFRNNSGVMFGGVLLLASDPFPAILFQKIIPRSTAYTVKHSIKYLKPATSSVQMQLTIKKQDVLEMSSKIKEKGYVFKEYVYSFRDTYTTEEIARVKTLVYIKRIQRS